MLSPTAANESQSIIITNCSSNENDENVEGQNQRRHIDIFENFFTPLRIIIKYETIMQQNITKRYKMK